MGKDMILVSNSGRVYRRNRRDILIGVLSSSGNNGYQMPMIDYDYFNPINDAGLFVMIDKLRLPDIYVFKTSRKKYMAICFKNIKRKDYFNMLFYINCCVEFRYCTIMVNRKATIRFTKKWYKKSSQLQLKYIIHSQYSYSENKKLKDEFFKVINYESKTIHCR
jgi:hypothetical protein